MPLSRLLPLLAAIVALATAALAGRMASGDWQGLQRARTAQQAVMQLRLALQAAEMLSRERGPTNAVLGAESPLPAERRSALAEARARTNAALEALAPALPADAAEAARRDAAEQFDAARTALQAARRVVDRLAERPRASRDAEALRAAVRGMAALVPLLAPAVSLFANDAQRADPALGAPVQGARLTAELREYAGLLGSHFTAALTRQQPFTAEERAAIERTSGRIDQLRFLVSLWVKSPGQSAAVVAAWQLMELHYFQQANKLVEEVIAVGSVTGSGTGNISTYGFDAAGFAAQYVPDMNTMFLLRDALIDEAAARAADEHARATWALVFVGAGSAVLFITLTVTVSVLRRRVLRPLAQASQALAALTHHERDGGAAPPPGLPRDEIAAVVGGVRTLQAQTVEREALEAQRNELIEELRDQSNTDFLTGVPNRRAFFAAAERELAQALRHGFGVVAVLIDVDHFKQFNDTHGHAAGDQALTEVAQTVRRALRLGDTVGRYGGEEFVLLLSHCDLAQGLRFAERLRMAIESIGVACPSGDVVRVTASFGLADSGRFGLRLDELLSNADAAMYQAKQAGRNRVGVALPAAPGAARLSP